MAQIMKINASKDAGQNKPLGTSGRNANRPDTKEVSIEIFIKLDTGLPYDPATPLLGKRAKIFYISAQQRDLHITVIKGWD